MPEFRVSHLLIGAVILALIGIPILVCAGYFAIPSFDVFGWKTPELTKKSLTQAADDAAALAAGYTPAKTPTEAMDKFRDAIQARKYKFAKVYVTKGYADMLERSAVNATEFGDYIDKIRNWGDNKGLLSDKTKIALFMLDPFPKNFKSGPAPKQDGDSKATGNYVWEQPYTLQAPNANILNEMRDMDPRMFQNILSYKAFNAKIDLVKEGDAWKINVPMNPAWETEIGYFNDRAKTYITGFEGFWSDVNRNQFDSKVRFEDEIFSKLRAAK